MNKKDISELRKRMNKSNCTFTRMSGCYVTSDKDVLLHINEIFLNLEDDEFDKYLAIAKKTLSGTLGNNLLELDFPLEEESTGGKQQFLLGLRESKLKNQELLETFYQLIIDNYDYVGNYLILVFHDAYDVIAKTKDNLKLDESEEVYEYLICAICPVKLTKAGLGYLEDENRIGPRHRDWVVSLPDTGFVFPAFTDRSTDIHSTMFYTKNTAEPHKELIESVLGCPSKPTATEQKNTFHSIVKAAVNDSEQENKVYGDIQESLSLLAQEQAELLGSEDEPVVLTNESVREILEENSLPEEMINKIDKAYEENFSEELPAVDYLLDKKVIAENNKLKAQKQLMEKVEVLEEQLEEARNNIENSIDEEFDVVLHIKPEKINQIKEELIDGKRHIAIPIDENEQVKINDMTDFSFL